RLIASIIGTGSRAFVALVGIAGITAAVANYAMTQGAGTNFGSVIVGGVHYAQQLICDVTTPSQCGAVTASGEQKVLDTQVLAAIQSAIPSQNPAVPVGGFGLCDGANGTTNPCTTVATVRAASTPAVATDKALVVDQRPGTIVPTSAASQYPSGATPITASATGTTGATTATLAGAVGKTTYICSLSVRSNATAAVTGNVTVTGPSVTLNYTHWTAPLASGIGVTEQVYWPCAP
ncbi:hypothetical protein, partial [Pseudomonas proteolytica]|uniref:hypothetical protein n=2 Tax=Pseudomonas proteolytica TaxID=219574 RepID=UPI0030DB3E40